MARNFSKGLNWKKLGLAVVAGILVLASVGGVFALFGKETKTIGASAFAVGALGDDGKYVKNEQAIYTKEAFACEGLKVVPDFEAKLTYEVYYYDAAEQLLSVEKNLTEDFEGSCPGADYARVVIYPEVPEGEKVKDFSINIFEIRSFAKQLNITVDREQEIATVLTKDVYVEYSGTGSFSAADVSQLSINAAIQASDVIAVDDKCSHYRVYVKLNELGDDLPVNIAFMKGVYYDEEGAQLVDNKAIYYNEKGALTEGYAYTFNADMMKGDVWYCVDVELPEEANWLRVQGPADAEIRIYGVDVK